ncbi:type I polyketide synthase, partial [Actinomadura rubrisoli]
MSEAGRRQCPVAIVGFDALMPRALDAAEFWRNVVSGQDLITEVPSTHWLVDDFYDSDPTAADHTYCRRGAFLPEIEFDPTEFGLLPKSMSATDTSQLLALFVAGRLLSGLSGDGDGDGDGHGLGDRDRVGVILGCTALEMLGQMATRSGRPGWLAGLRRHGISQDEAETICDRITELSVPWQESTFPGLLTNVVAGRIAKTFDLHGTNCTLDAACASSLAALSMAIGELELHRADLVLTGGVDTLNDPLTFLCFSKTPALSPSGDCRPFAESADGTVLGEGLSMFALKRLEDAERDGDPIHAVIRGVGSSSDGRSSAIYTPQKDGQVRAMRRAYGVAGYGPETVELVEAHGTGTLTGDATEVASLRDVFDRAGRADRQWCALGSVKSQIGHTKAAAGAAGLLKATLALQHRVLPPTAKVDRPHPALDLETSPFYLNTAARPWIHPGTGPRRAAVSSFGFGGTNFHLTLEEHRPGGGGRPAPRLRTMPSELVLLGADSPGALIDRCAGLDVDRPLETIARDTQERFTEISWARLAIVATSTSDLAERLGRARGLLGREAATALSFPGLHYGSGPPEDGLVAFLFPGQGVQYPGMSGDLAMAYPDALAVWDQVAGWEHGDVLCNAVFPRPAFEDGEREAQEAWLTATEQAQPATAAHSLVLLALLRRLGIRADCVAGHSFGELTALHAAGVLDAAGLLRTARRRGELMRASVNRPTAMVAVSASQADVESAVTDAGGALWISGRNAPEQTVVSGTREAIDALLDELARRRLPAHRLETALAFHTPLLEDAAQPFLEHLRQVDIQSPSMSVYGNADAACYPPEPDEIRHRMTAHLTAPVRFSDEIEEMYRAGVRTFIEVGPGAVLSGLVGRIFGGRPHCAVNLDRRGTDGVTSLHDALGRLAVRGITADYRQLWAGYAERNGGPAREPSPLAVRLSGTNYGKPYPPAEQEEWQPPTPCLL